MKQVTLRLPERLLADLKAAASAREQSVNTFAAAVLSAAVDPELAGDERERIRARLAKAGLLVSYEEAAGRRPPEAELAHARVAAGRGTPLSDLVREGRG